jgi:phosphatidylserine decarboxylase
MKFSRHGLPFLAASIVLLFAAVLITRDWAPWARASALLFCVSLLILFLIFFRDPERTPPAEEGSILAPADGRIIRVSEATDEALPGETRILVSIFMSIWNVHVNRAPITGEVIRKWYRPGRFVPAFRDEASSQNEQCSLLIAQGDRSILLRQISGVIARRIITYPEEGDRVVRGERFGMILFGSRLDILLPVDSRIRVSVGEKTVAGQTVLGVFP